MVLSSIHHDAGGTDLEKTMQQKKSDKSKIYGSIIAISIVILAVASIWFLWQYPRTKAFGDSGKFQKEEVEELSKEIIELISGQEYEKVMSQYAGPMLTKDADASDLEYAVKTVNTDWGELKSITPTTLAEMIKAGKRYAAAELEAEYENLTVIFTFSFDEDMRLSGIYMKEYTGE